MKKLIAIVLTVALVITLFAVVAPVGAKTQPAGGRAVFEADLIEPPWRGSLDQG